MVGKEECDGSVVGEGVVLLFDVRLVFVGKPACSHICRLVIVASVLKHCSLRLSCLVSEFIS